MFAGLDNRNCLDGELIRSAGIIPWGVTLLSKEIRKSSQAAGCAKELRLYTDGQCFVTAFACTNNAWMPDLLVTGIARPNRGAAISYGAAYLSTCCITGHVQSELAAAGLQPQNGHCD
jgi:hypothetical protein